MRSPRSLPQAAPRAGHTLMEIMVVVSIMGVLIGVTMPCHRKAVEQTRVDVAAAHLRSIWAAQRLYYLDHRSYASTFDALASEGLIDTAPLAADACYVYSIAQGGSSFSATAARSNSGVYAGTLSIGPSGVVSGAITGGGGISLSPGFN